MGDLELILDGVQELKVFDILSELILEEFLANQGEERL